MADFGERDLEDEPSGRPEGGLARSTALCAVSQLSRQLSDFGAGDDWRPRDPEPARLATSGLIQL
jgi:hypothetical protein